MVDQKALREMMKQEKERRQAEKNALKQKLKEKTDAQAMPPPAALPIPAKKRAASVPGEAPAAGSSPSTSSSSDAAMPPPAFVPVKKAVAPTVPTFSEPASSSSQPAAGKSAPAERPKGSLLGLGSYDDDSDEEGSSQQPPAKRPHTGTPNGVAASLGDSVVIAGAGADPAAVENANASSSQTAVTDVEMEGPKSPPKPVFEPIVQIGRNFDDPKPAEQEKEEEKPMSVIPEGFFDDPEQDAKVRGVEAPSARKERELTEGLKLFERQMEQEVEKSEATRHELDEEAYEKNFNLEQQKQKAYWNKLERLRKIREEKAAEAAAASAASATVDAEAGGDKDDDEGDSSGSDLDFDWRAKAVG